MYKNHIVEIGDILQHRPKKGDWLGAITNFVTLNGGYVHTAIYIGKGLKAEAHAGRKFNVIKILPDEVEIIDVYRVLGGLDMEQKEKLMKCVESKYGVEYNTLGLLGSLRSSVGSLLNWKWLRQSKPIAREEGKQFCSEIISNIYNEALSIDIVPDVSDYVTTPNDITRSKALERES